MKRLTTARIKITEAVTMLVAVSDYLGAMEQDDNSLDNYKEQVNAAGTLLDAAVQRLSEASGMVISNIPEIAKEIMRREYY